MFEGRRWIMNGKELLKALAVLSEERGISEDELLIVK